MFRQFENWNEVVAFMHDETQGHANHDRVLIPLIQRYQGEVDQRAVTVLTLVMWPALRALERHLLSLDSNADAVWSALYWMFVRTLHDLDLKQVVERYAFRLKTTVRSRVRESYRREWRRKERSLDALLVDEDGEEVEFDVAAIDSESVNRQAVADQEAQIQVLARACADGVINETERALLLGCDIYGQTAREVGRKLDLSRDAAKKRLWRARGRVTASREVGSEDLSPLEPLIPPYIVEAKAEKGAGQ